LHMRESNEGMQMHGRLDECGPCTQMR